MEKAPYYYKHTALLNLINEIKTHSERKKYDEESIFGQLPDMPFYCFYYKAGDNQPTFHYRRDKAFRINFMYRKNIYEPEVWFKIETEEHYHKSHDDLVYWKYNYYPMKREEFIKAIEIILPDVQDFITSLIEG